MAEVEPTESVNQLGQILNRIYDNLLLTSTLISRMKRQETTCVLNGKEGVDLIEIS